jgi:hypothetical protein
MTLTTQRHIVVSFTDRHYYLSHLRAPRGRGAWAFLISGEDLPMLWSPGSLTYTAAKVWAKAEVQRLQAAGVIPAHVTWLTLATQP